MDEEDFGGMMDKMKQMLEKVNTYKVLKTVAATEEEVLEWMALQGFAEAAKKALGVHSAKKNLFWAKIELRIGEVNRQLHYNDEKQVIEIMEDEENKKNELNL